MSTQRPIECNWRPFDMTAYRLETSLSSAEQVALASSHSRSGMSRMDPVPDLIRPLADIAAASGCGRKITRLVITRLLREMHVTGIPCWCWSQERWQTLCREVRDGRPLIAAFAWHLADLHDPLSLPDIRKPALYASAIFGQAFYHQELQRLTDTLTSLGYAPASQKNHVSGILATLMIVNRDPRLESFTPELLWQVQSGMEAGTSRYVGRVSHALAALGIISTPMRMRNYTQWYEKPVEGIDPAWVHWCRRWRETSVLRPRSCESLYSFILRCGLWLAEAHPEVREPADWTMETCASFIAAVGRMNVDDLQLGTERGIRKSVRSGEPMMPHSRANFIYSLRRFMIDYENWGWGRLRFSPARHLSTPDTPLFRRGVNPRVIDDPVWLKLIWASLNLRQEDLLTEIHYPLAMLQAMAVIWTHAGLRKNELLRLTTGCITPQADEIVKEDGSIIPAGTLCYLHIPAGKTSKAFVKPVAAVVKKYVDLWLDERPAEQAMLADDRTGEKVRLLFQYRGKPAGSAILNRTVIPMLCARAGVPSEDSGGMITSHRGRASAVTALASVPQGMSLYELMQWTGHSTPQSTMHYIRIRPTQLAASFAKADRVAHMISVLIDHDPDAASLTGPATYYDLGDSYCTNPFWSSCQHRMACIGCDFNLLKDSARGLILESKASIRRYLEEVPLTPDERAILEQDAEKVGHALTRPGPQS
ncbi:MULTISPECIES: tyrosine-type recombinase/integrase [Enterobacterales]|uniref:Integrase n=2 Tax=Pantoea TaxID=53335 RepID=A0A518XJR3_9GAMM|nr:MULTISPECIES: tyrosine-type recombinase/integrase [Enterobacterales]MCQ0899211.1 tyrosine-type recombinase/integrase [Klebsiella pneumoniae]QDY44423.1 integrase [Pantoea soli]TQC70067.1 tyrosine-type recombinase/integrase [Pantoea dispersa]WEA04789.1 tyrosine-type recombinase/integrase [Pantoea dispersa]